MTSANAPDSQPELARSPSEVDDWLDLIDYLTGEFADNDRALECELENMSVDVPMRMTSDAETANWRFDGGVTMSVGEVRVPLRDWMQYWERSSD
jgi:hypothetical protein